MNCLWLDSGFVSQPPTGRAASTKFSVLRRMDVSSGSVDAGNRIFFAFDSLSRLFGDLTGELRVALIACKSFRKYG